jgi:hypothetical protein
MALLYIHVYAAIHFCDIVWPLRVEIPLCWFFIVFCIHLFCHVRANYQKGRDCVPSLYVFLYLYDAIHDLDFHMSWYCFFVCCSMILT